jgi:hypothetical protein
MRHVLTLCLALGLSAGCAGTGGLAPERRAAIPEPIPSPIQKADLAVAGWRVPFECYELSERIQSSQSRLYEAVSGLFSTDRTTDERRLRALEARADELGCLVPGSPFTY